MTALQRLDQIEKDAKFVFSTLMSKGDLSLEVRRLLATRAQVILNNAERVGDVLRVVRQTIIGGAGEE